MKNVESWRVVWIQGMGGLRVGMLREIHTPALSQSAFAVGDVEGAGIVKYGRTERICAGMMFGMAIIEVVTRRKDRKMDL